MKKRIGIIAGIAAYVGLSVAVCLGAFEPKQEESAAETGQAGTENVDAVEPTEKTDNREFPFTENILEYGNSSQSGFYVETDDLVLHEDDMKSILAEYSLPELERMSEEDTAEKMADLQVLKKIEALGIDVEELYTPEYNWKALYNDSITTVDKILQLENVDNFTGTTASELNGFLADKSNTKVLITSERILLDETIHVPSDIVLDGNGVEVYGDNAVDYALMLENVENVAIQNMRFTSGFGQGLYIINSKCILIYNNEITNAIYKGLCVMGTNSYVNVVNNSVHDNWNGGIFFDGDISRCIIQGNSIYQNRGTRNLTAGLVFTSVILEDIYTPYNEFRDEHLYDLLDVPNNNVIKDNLIQGNNSSGFYSDGGYMNYVINNTIEDNEKEGMCLDYGTFGTYVSSNIVQRNGDRNRQTDEDLVADFIYEWGRLPDGSSKAKLPGISIDNSAYNIVYQNDINGNSGSGVKMVRSGYRNIILANIVTDNNAGQHESYHGFGIELGHASEPDEPVIGLDFTADYENIVARNVISGHHYSGIYLAEDSYCNDLIDNVIFDCTEFSIENHSEYYNSAVGNNTNVGTLNFTME